MRIKELYRVTMETKVELNAIEEKIKWHNRRYEVYGLLCLSISRDLLFHLDGLHHQMKYGRSLKIYLER